MPLRPKPRRIHVVANGKPGDHPVNDICDHGLAVFSPKADSLVREIHKLVPRQMMWDLVDWFSPPPILELERQLEEIRNRLRDQAKTDAWELD